MEEFFLSREDSMVKLKKSLEQPDNVGTNHGVLGELKREMVSLMEADIQLWHQLSDLNQSIKSLSNEFVVTRCRSSSYLCDRATEHETLDEIPETKPRAHSFNSSFEETRRDAPADFLFRNTFVELEPHIIDPRMRETRHVTSLIDKQNNFLNYFHPLNITSGLYSAKFGSFKNNVFLSSLHVGLIGMVDDLVKPLSSKQILPRRKLHRQAKVLPSDEVQNKQEQNYNSDFPNSDRSKQSVSTTCESNQIKETFTNSASDITPIQKSNEVNNKENNNNDNINSSISESRTYNTEPEINENIVDNFDDKEVEDFNSSFLVFEDGYVSCRIMTPGLEEQIKLKHENEEEPLEYLKCKSGYARFRSESDSESNYSTDNCLTSEEAFSMSNDLSDEIRDVCSDIRYLFENVDDINEQTCEDHAFPNSEDSDNEDNDVKSIISSKSETDHVDLNETGGCPDLDETKDTNFISEAVNDQITLLTDKAGSNVIHDTDPAINDSIEGNKVLDPEADEELNNVGGGEIDRQQLSVDDMVTITTKEVLTDGLSVFVYKEKQCNFTYRISSVDSGIGDELSD